MHSDRDSGSHATCFTPHAEQDMSIAATAGSRLQDDSFLPRASRDYYPLRVRAAIFLLGGGGLWAGIIAAVWRLLR